MTDALVYVVYVVLGCAGLLFLGGMASAALENRREKRETGRVSRPGWRRSERPESPDYTAPGRTGWVIWPLTFIGRPDLAERYLQRRAVRRVHG